MPNWIFFAEMLKLFLPVSRICNLPGEVLPSVWPTLVSCRYLFVILSMKSVSIGTKGKRRVDDNIKRQM